MPGRWIFLSAIVLALALLARPRRRQRSWRRWGFNFGAVSSSLICIACIAAWVRSYHVSEQWLFAPRPPQANAMWPVPLVAQRLVSSERGELIWQERQAPGSGPITFAPLPTGYQRQWLVDYRVFVGGSGKGRRQLRWPGIGYYSADPAVLWAPPALRGIAPPSYMFLGVRALVVSWWLLVLISAILPVLWICSAVTWRRRMSKDGAAGSIPCSSCGYDIRASLDRCPECGHSAPIGH